MSKNLKVRPRLGRGLSSLIPMSGDDASAEAGAVETSLATGSQTQPTEATVPGSSVQPSTPPVGEKSVEAVPEILAPGSSQLRMISVEAIQPNPSQPRRQFDSAALSEL